MNLPESMIGYSQRIDELCAIYNVCPDKSKNKKCVKKKNTSNNQMKQASTKAKCTENPMVTKTSVLRTQNNGLQKKQSQDIIPQKSKPLKCVESADLPRRTEPVKAQQISMVTKTSEVRTQNNGPQKKQLQDSIPQKSKPLKCAESADLLRRTEQVKAQKSKTTVLNRKLSEQMQQQNSQKKVCAPKAYETKQMAEKQRKKKVTIKHLQLEWKDFEKTLQTDIYMLQQLFNADINSVFSFGANILNKLQEAPGGTAMQKMAWKGRVYYYFMKAYSASGDYVEALELSSLLLRMASTTKDEQLLYNSYNVTAKVYVKLEDYHKAATLWEKMFKHTKNFDEQAYILHEIGRCHYAISEWSEARMFGNLSLSAATQSGNRKWCMNANLLIGQADIQLEHPKQAIQAFEEAELYASTINDESVLNYTDEQKKLLQNVIEAKRQ